MADAPALKVLTCQACGAPVPLAKAERTRCPHCSAEVVVPDAHRQALELAEQQVQADRLTQRAFLVLGRPPVLPLRAFGFIGPGVTLLFCCFYVRLVGALETWAAGLAERHLAVNAYDWLTAGEQWVLRWCTLAALCILSVVLGALGRRRAVRRAALKAALHARAPEKKGGPALCRACGAPLTVPPNAWGVRCAYCFTDNLTAIPHEWLATARRQVKDIAREAHEAIRQQKAVEYRFKRDFGLNVGIVVAVAALAVGTSVYRLHQQHPDPDWDLRAALKARHLIGREYVSQGQPAPVPSRVPLDNCRGHWRLPNDEYDCLGHRCWVGWFVALRAGERLMVAPQSKGTVKLYAHVLDHPWQLSYGGLDYWGRLAAQADVDAQHPARLLAPVSAWYRVNLDLQPEQPGEGLPLCAGIE